MQEKAFRLVTLGRLALSSPAGHEVDGLDELNARRRKLALLAVLALRRRPVSRDTLVEMFWGGQEEARARHSLSDAVSHLRRVLGRDAIVATRSELALDDSAPVIVDAVEFAALAATADQRRRALEMYEGRFMEGVFVSGSSTFEHWLSSEQARFERMFVTACKLECASATDVAHRAALAQRWLDADPLSADAALTLIDALIEPGTVESSSYALAAYERLRARIAREYDIVPDQRVVERIAQIAASMHAATPLVVATPIDDTTASHRDETLVHTGAIPTRANHRRRTRRTMLALLGIAAVVVPWLVMHRGRVRTAGGLEARPVVAVVEMLAAGSDSASRWLTDALPQMISTKLLRNSDVEVIPQAAIRALRARTQSVGAPLTPAELHDLGRRAGANLVVAGAFLQQGRVVLLDLRLLDLRSGETTRLQTVADSSVLALVDRAAVRVLDAAGAAGSAGPRFAEVETSSLPAYQHFVRWSQVGYEHPAEAVAELDAAIALDSGFTSAVLARVIQAIADNDGSTTAKLSAVLHRRSAQIPERDRLEWESRVRFMDGDIEQSEALARMLVNHYPRDPRGYQMLATIYDVVGRWDAEEQVLERLLSLDSLGLEAGRGPCISCYGLGSLATVRLFRGDWAGADRVAKRWTTLTPEMHAAWTNLALAKAYHGAYDEASIAAARALALAPDEPSVLLTSAWVKVMARDLDGAEAEIEKWQTSDSRAIRMNAYDVRTTIQRERGQFRAANATIQRAIAEFPEIASLGLVAVDGLARVGKCRDAVDAIEAIHAGRPMNEEPAPGGPSRAFAWHHALLADAIARAPRCDGAPSLAALADSVERIARRSYYGRDWVLHHHIRGLLAERQGDFALAEEELKKAQWRIGDGWTRSMAELGSAQLIRGHPVDAVATLRNAYAARPDAMGRYQPRSELDLLMALAFRQSGLRDSAAVYEGYVRRAWASADPEVRARLSAF